MRRVLYLLNSPARRPVIPVDRWFAEAGFAVELYWAFGSEFPRRVDGYAGAFLSGSPHSAYEDLPWIRREHEVIRELAAAGVPTLGVCFGSQVLASALCGRDQVFRRQVCEVGFDWVRLREAARWDPLTRGFSDRLFMAIWHNDEVRADHPAMTLLGSTDACANQIWRYRDLPVWGIQGHPEVTAEYAPAWLEAHRARLAADGADVDRMLQQSGEAGEAKHLLDNFIAVCAEGGGR